MPREPQFVSEYAEVLDEIGPTAFATRFRRPVLIGYGLAGIVSDRPKRWRRRTLPTDDSLREVAKVQSIVDRVWPIRKDPGSPRGSRISLGASAECDVVFPDYSVSTCHCAFSFQPGRIVITDLKSLNGTSINGKSIVPSHTTPLPDRCALLIGRIKVQFLTRDSFFELVSRHLKDRR